MSDDNDFLGSSFSNYETTEHKMLGDDDEVGSGGSSGAGGHQKQVFTVAGKETSTGKMIVGFVVLVIGGVIGLAVMGEQETAIECLAGAGIMIAALAGAFAIWLHKDK